MGLKNVCTVVDERIVKDEQPPRVKLPVPRRNREDSTSILLSPAPSSHSIPHKPPLKSVINRKSGTSKGNPDSGVARITDQIGSNHHTFHAFDDRFWDYKDDLVAWGDQSSASGNSDRSFTMFSSPGSLSSKSSVSGDLEQVPKFPRPPRYPEICIKWLRGRCIRGHLCNYVHENIEYDDPTVNTILPLQKAPIHEIQSDALKSTRVFQPANDTLSTTIYDHIKLSIGPGFEIFEITTGFESSCVLLSNVPTRVTMPALYQLLQPFGQSVDIRMPSDQGRSKSSTMLVKAYFKSHKQAMEACSALHGTHPFGVKLSARLSVNDPKGRSITIDDTAVRIQWEAPGKTGYGGYSALEQANKAIAATRMPFGDSYIKAIVHSGLPVVGVVTVRFSSLPLDADERSMERFAHPEDVMWERPNYTSLPRAVNGIRRILENDGSLVEFDVLPPPYKDGKVLAWAHFSTPTDAMSACRRLHGRRPVFTGQTTIYARHLKTISYTIDVDAFSKISSDIESLRQSLYGKSRNSYISVIRRPAWSNVIIKLCAEDMKDLGRLKAEMDKYLTGEVVREDGKVVWDDFFARAAGINFQGEIERKYSGVKVSRDVPRRMIRLFGPSAQRKLVHRDIVNMLSFLQKQKVDIIYLGRLIGPFIKEELLKLQAKCGQENVTLDLWDCNLKIRHVGNIKAVRETVDALRQRHALRPPTLAVVCPVCLDEVTDPITLGCGHVWCRACLHNFFIATIEQKLFPITCLGNEARCSRRISLRIARDILSIQEYESATEAAFSAHLQHHANEFYYCPTSDCPQVYRSAPKGTLLQCPSCLVRICTECHAEAHDGLACAEADGGAGLFKVWMNDHDVKSCPGCKVPIERVEGCNHMTCSRCHTHICWVCMETFPRGEGIYGHMRFMHGGFGLGAIDDD